MGGIWLVFGEFCLCVDKEDEHNGVGLVGIPEVYATQDDVLAGMASL